MLWWLLITYGIGLIGFLFKQQLGIFKEMVCHKEIRNGYGHTLVEDPQMTHRLCAGLFLFSPIIVPLFFLIWCGHLIYHGVANLSTNADKVGEFLINAFKREKSNELEQLRQELAALKEKVKE